jgi:dTMP kinase
VPDRSPEQGCSADGSATANKDEVDTAPGPEAEGEEAEDTGPLRWEGIQDKSEAESQPSVLSLFGSPSFFRLWLAQVVSSLGDWIGLVAITAVAARVGGSDREVAITLVLSARLVPGFFIGPAAGVLVDRWDRKRVMVACDVGRGLVLATVPFIDTVVALVLASLLLEVMTLLWAPAKEATVPKLVPQEFLANANSFSLVAAYGTFPLGAGIFALLAGVAKWLGNYDALQTLRVSQESVALWFDVATFFASALFISTLELPRIKRAKSDGAGIEFRKSINELVDGLRCIKESPIVRSVILGIGTGLIGGGMLVPLGPVMSKDVLGGGTAGFGLLVAALGTGVAGGILALSVLQKRVPHERIFVVSVLGAGVFQVLGASMSTLTPTLVLVALLGLCAGSVYILGFTILQANVEDELRGRIFATLYTLIRFCVLLAFAVAPILSRLLDKVSDNLVGRSVRVADIVLFLPGVRLTLWLGGVIIVFAGVLAGWLLRARSPA